MSDNEIATEMPVASNMLTIDPIAAEAFSDAFAAAGRPEEIYRRNTAFLRAGFKAYLNGSLSEAQVRAV